MFVYGVREESAQLQELEVVPSLFGDVLTASGGMTQKPDSDSDVFKLMLNNK